VPEVWFWENDRLPVHSLENDDNVTKPRSKFLPGLDLDLLCSFLDRPTAIQAVKAFRAALAQR
jgi:hypothetical protein